MTTTEKELLDKDNRAQYEFRDKDVAIYRTEKGLDENTVREISKIKNEPQWMLEFRLKALKEFERHHQPSFGPDLNWINFQDYTYYTKISDKVADNWEDVPDTVKNTFDKLGIPEAEQKFLSGVTTQYESEAVYSNMLKEVNDKGVVFLDMDSGLREYPEIVKKYFGKLVPPQDNKYAALNSAVWSGGSFIYVPKGVKLDKPLQSYFRINNKRSGQFERTLIIVDDDAELNYVEGCTAPMYSEESLHAAIVDDDGLMEWVDGNIGSKLCMKYPCCVLKGDRAKGSTISVAVASQGQFQDTGAKMIHLGKDTSSNIISKSISKDGGTANFRGQIHIAKGALNSRAHEECDTLIIDSHSYSDTIPNNVVENASSYLEHEASVSKINEDQLFYLMSRGLSKSQATQMIVMGFLEPFAKELPMEYAVELNQLIKMDMTGSIG